MKYIKTFENYKGYLKDGKYVDGYDNPLKCFKCDSNLITKTFSFPLQHGGNGELCACKDHEHDAEIEVEERRGNVTKSNMNSSGS